MQLGYYKSFSKAQRATLSQDSVKGVGLFETGVIMIMRRCQICFTLIGDPLLLNKLRTKLPVKPTRPPLNETLNDGLLIGRNIKGMTWCWAALLLLRLNRRLLPDVPQTQIFLLPHFQSPLTLMLRFHVRSVPHWVPIRHFLKAGWVEVHRITLPPK